MDLFDAISRRKSCRKYISEPLSEMQLEEIEMVLHTFEPLFPNASLNYRFVNETTGMFNIKAPHYLVISGEGKEREKENAGFIGEQFMLWLDVHELGGVWLGSSKDATVQRNNFDIIVIAFGKPEGSPHRELSEFKRKNISEITNNIGDECIKAVHLAPSGLNLQPWYFEKKGDRVLVYRQLLKPPTSLAYKLTKVDIGIALCHYAMACKHFGKNFRFTAEEPAEAKKGYEFFGAVES